MNTWSSKTWTLRSDFVRHGGVHDVTCFADFSAAWELGAQHGVVRQTDHKATDVEYRQNALDRTQLREYEARSFFVDAVARHGVTSLDAVRHAFRSEDVMHQLKPPVTSWGVAERLISWAKSLQQQHQLADTHTSTRCHESEGPGHGASERCSAALLISMSIIYS